jgi:RNA polymerase sigma factor (sigma-70 family)
MDVGVEPELPPSWVDAHPGSPAADRPDPQFAEWARPSLLAMTRLAQRLAPHAEAEDVVQEALARAWIKRAQYDPSRGTATTWLLAITADQARSARRANVRRLRVVDDTAELPEGSALDPDAAADLDLDRAIGELADRQRLAVQLHYFVGLSVEETAAVMNASIGTVKSTLFDARTRLRRLLGDSDEH